ncbi:het domain protein [Apiospora kogelbergensis]|uniref:Het domain protein n=1 Tax=Apiospora kogelbergensis TaxID=1337665 RepID=A0AAW0QDA8_9PEZI
MQLGVLLFIREKDVGIFASSPLHFRTARNLKHRIKNFCVEKEFAVTNRGLKIETALVLDESGNTILNLGISHRDNWGPTSSDGWKGIYLSKTPDGYVRSRPWALYTARNNRYIADAPPTIHIRKHVSPAESKRLEHRFAGGVRVRTRAQIQQVAPGHLWDPTRRTFMQQGRGINAWVVIYLPTSTPSSRARGGSNAPRPAPTRAIVACSTMGYEVGSLGGSLCTVWVEGQGAWRDALGFLETRKETADYVAADYLTKFVASTQSAKLAPSQSHLFVDGAGNKMAVTARLSGCNIEGVPGYCLDIAVETLVSNPAP